MLQEVNGDILVLTPEMTQLDASQTRQFKDEVLGLIKSTNKKNVVIDLSRLQFVDSSGLGCFLSILKSLSHEQGTLKFSGLTKSVRTIFELVSIHKILEIYPTKEEALKSFEI